MPVQFSRGCPFDCEFCDIVVMNGRVPRTKEPAQLVRELEALRLAGWKDMVFIVDDNFIGKRKQAMEMLRALIEWRHRVKPTMGFLTEASVNLADYADLCGLMVEAGFKKVFVGIETPSVEGLEECGKTQNRKARSGRVGENAPAGRAGGDGRLHRRIRLRPAGHLRAAIRVHSAHRRRHRHGGPAHRITRDRPLSTAGGRGPAFLPKPAATTPTRCSTS